MWWLIKQTRQNDDVNQFDSHSKSDQQNIVIWHFAELLIAIKIRKIQDVIEFNFELGKLLIPLNMIPSPVN